MTCYRCREKTEVDYVLMAYCEGEEVGTEELCEPCYKLYEKFSRGDAVKGINE